MQYKVEKCKTMEYSMLCAQDNCCNCWCFRLVEIFAITIISLLFLWDKNTKTMKGNKCDERFLKITALSLCWWVIFYRFSFNFFIILIIIVIIKPRPSILLIVFFLLSFSFLIKIVYFYPVLFLRYFLIHSSFFTRNLHL